MLARSLKVALVISEKILFFFISFYSLHLVYISYSDQEISSFFYMLSLFGMLGGIYNLTVPVILNQDALKEVEDPDSWFFYLSMQIIGVALLFALFSIFDLSRGSEKIAFIVYLIVSFKRFEIFIHFLLNYGNVYVASIISVLGRVLFLISLILVSKYKIGFYFAYLMESLIVAGCLSCYLLYRFELPQFPNKKIITSCVSRINKNRNIIYATLLLSIYTYLDAVMLGNYLDDTEFSSYSGTIRLILAVGVISSFVSSFLSRDIVYLFKKGEAFFMVVAFILSVLVIAIIYRYSHLMYPYLSILYGDKWIFVYQYMKGAVLSVPVIFFGNIVSKAISLSNISFIEPLKQAIGVILYLICIPILLHFYGPHVLGWLYSAISFVVYILIPTLVVIYMKKISKESGYNNAIS